MAPNLFRRRVRPEREHALRPAKGERERVHEVAVPRARRLRVALHRHDPDRQPPDPGLEPAEEFLVGEHDVQVRPVGRRADRVREARQALVQMGEQPVPVEALEVQPSPEPALEDLEVGRERVQHPSPIHARVIRALDEEGAQARDDIRRREVRRDEDVRRLELAARLGRVRVPPLVIDQLCEGIRERGRRVGDRGPPDRVDVEHPRVRVREERVVHMPRERVELLRHRGARVRPPIAPPGEERAVLLEHDPVVHQESPVQQVRHAGGRDAVLPELREPARSCSAAQRSEREGDEIHVSVPLGLRGERAAPRRAHPHAVGRNPGGQGSEHRAWSSADLASRPTP